MLPMSALLFASLQLGACAFTFGPCASRPAIRRLTIVAVEKVPLTASAVEEVPLRWSSPSKSRPAPSLPYVTPGGRFTAADMSSLEHQFAVARLRMEKDAAAAAAACDAIEAERTARTLQHALTTSRAALQKTRRELVSTRATLEHELQLVVSRGKAGSKNVAVQCSSAGKGKPDKKLIGLGVTMVRNPKLNSLLA